MSTPFSTWKRLNRIHKAPVISLLLLGSLFGATSAFAQAFDPVIELFRLDADDMLVIDRSGPLSQAGDVNGDGIEDVIIASGIGSVRVVFGPNRGDNGRLSVVTLNGSNGFSINGDGPHASSAGDVNGDGLGDVMIGSAQATYVVFGSRDGFSKNFDVATLDGSNGFVVPVNTSSVSEAGDMNGDGIDDIIIGSTSAAPQGRASAGASHIIFGRAGDFPASVSPASLNGITGFTLQGAVAGEESGYQVAAAGDFNNDGLADVLIGAPRATSFDDTLAGKAYLVYGSRTLNSGVLDLAALGAAEMLVYQGRGFEHFTGRAVSFVGDINRDGIDDIGIGAPGRGPFGEPSDYPGKVVVLFGGTLASTTQQIDESELDGTNGFVLNGIRGGIVPVQEGQPEWGDLAGDSLDFAGDINGDGVDDMVIGATQSIINPLRTGNGQAYIVYGNPAGFPAQLNLADLDGNNGFRLNGIGTTDYTGFSVSRAGDFSGDGIDDVLIGAAGQGDSYLFYGRRTGAVAGPITSVGAPGNFRVTLYSSTNLELFWTQPDLPIANYEVSRNEEVIASLAGNRGSYSDSGLQADGSYTYSIVAIAENGVRSEPATVIVDMATFTPNPVTPDPDPATPPTDPNGPGDEPTPVPVDGPVSDPDTPVSGPVTDPDLPGADPVLPTDNPSSPVDDAPIANGAITTGSFGWPGLITLLLLGLRRRPKSWLA